MIYKNIIFTEGGNLNTNNNNDSFSNGNNYKYNEDSSDNEQFEISLKQFEKSENKNLNNLIINSGGCPNNNVNMNKNHTENVTTRQNQNKKMSIFTEKRKNTMTITSYSKETNNNKKIKKDFKKYFNEGKSCGDNNTNYNFFNFRNICLDKKMLFDNNNKFSSLKNNRTSSHFKSNKIIGKNKKGINDNFRIKNINQKNYKFNNNTNYFRRMGKPSKNILK